MCLLVPYHGSQGTLVYTSLKNGVWEMIQNKIIDVKHIHSKTNLTDLNTGHPGTIKAQRSTEFPEQSYSSYRAYTRG